MEIFALCSTKGGSPFSIFVRFSKYIKKKLCLTSAKIENNFIFMKKNWICVWIYMDGRLKSEWNNIIVRHGKWGWRKSWITIGKNFLSLFFSSCLVHATDLLRSIIPFKFFAASTTIVLNISICRCWNEQRDGKVRKFIQTCYWYEKEEELWMQGYGLEICSKELRLQKERNLWTFFVILGHRNHFKVKVLNYVDFQNQKETTWLVDSFYTCCHLQHISHVQLWRPHIRTFDTFFFQTNFVT